VRMGRMNSAQHCQDNQQTPWQHGLAPDGSLNTVFDRLEKTTLKAQLRCTIVLRCVFSASIQKGRSLLVRSYLLKLP